MPNRRPTPGNLCLSQAKGKRKVRPEVKEDVGGDMNSRWDSNLKRCNANKVVELTKLLAAAARPDRDPKSVLDQDEREAGLSDFI